MNINDSKGTSIQTFVHCCNVDVTVSIIEQSELCPFVVLVSRKQSCKRICVCFINSNGSLLDYRDGGPEGLTVMVDYYTEDGTANAGSDYIPVKGTLTFYPEDKHQKVGFRKMKK